MTWRPQVRALPPQPYGFVAQLVERLTVNQDVASSSLAGPAILWLHSSVAQSASLSRWRSWVRVPLQSPCGRSSVGLERLVVAQEVADSSSAVHPKCLCSSVGRAAPPYGESRWFEANQRYQRTPTTPQTFPGPAWGMPGESRVQYSRFAYRLMRWSLKPERVVQLHQRLPYGEVSEFGLWCWPRKPASWKAPGVQIPPSSPKRPIGSWV